MFEEIENSKKTYEKIIEQIQKMILLGKLKKGDKLPSERQLCEQLGVGRTSLKQAISVLESIGIVESKHGTGNYIVEDNTHSLITPLSLIYSLNGGDLNNLMQLRYILETQAIKLVTSNATEEDINKLIKILDMMKNINDNEEKKQIHFIFHKTLIDIVDNILLSTIYESIHKLIYYQTFFSDDYNCYYNHKLIVDAILEKNPDKASGIMSKHLNINLYNKNKQQ